MLPGSEFEVRGEDPVVGCFGRGRLLRVLRGVHLEKAYLDMSLNCTHVRSCEGSLPGDVFCGECSEEVCKMDRLMLVPSLACHDHCYCGVQSEALMRVS